MIIQFIQKIHTVTIQIHALFNQLNFVLFYIVQKYYGNTSSDILYSTKPNHTIQINMELHIVYIHEF